MNELNQILDGYIRVSDIIAPFTGIEFVPTDRLYAAADKGTEVHTYIEGFLKGFPFRTMPSHIKPYFDCWLAWAEKQPWFGRDHGLQYETRLYSKSEGFTGQMDLIVCNDDHTLAYDWKTSLKESISWKLQGAAYHELLRNNLYLNPKPVCFVHLSKDMDAKEYRYLMLREDKDIFFQCLNLYKYFSMEKTRLKKRR